MTNPNIHADEPTALYRLYDADDRLLYLGVSRHPEFRWKEHANEKPWWHQVARKTVEWHDDRAAAIAAGTDTAAEEKPLYEQSWRHTQHQPCGGFDDTENKRTVRDILITNISNGVYPTGMRLVTGTVAQECGVARATAANVMHRLAFEDKILRHLYHGRYEVAGRLEESPMLTNPTEPTTSAVPRQARGRKSTKTPSTYLVGMEGSPLVKIGFTSGDPKKRLASLQTGQPMTLSLLWSTLGDHEGMLHQRFRRYRIRGEWFDLTPLGDPVQAVKDAIKSPDTDLPASREAAPVQAEGARSLASKLDCICGHSKGNHPYGSCTVTGWDESRDCQCGDYTSKSVLESIDPLTRAPEIIPFPSGWHDPPPSERVAAEKDPRYSAVYGEIQEMVWPGGGKMIPGYWPEHLAKCILWRLRTIEDGSRHPAVILGEIVRLTWPYVDVPMVPGFFAERLADRITACLS